MPSSSEITCPHPTGILRVFLNLGIHIIAANLGIAPFDDVGVPSPGIIARLRYRIAGLPDTVRW